MPENCFVCRKKKLGDENYKSIANSQTPNSKKTLKAVLTHLAKIINMELKLSPRSSACQNCFQALVQYDECALQLLKVQKNLTEMLQMSTRSHSSKFDDIVEEDLLDLSPGSPFVTKDDEDCSSLDNMLADDMSEEEISLPELCDVKLEVQELMEHELESLPSSPPTIRIATSCPHCQKLFKNKTRLKFHITQEHKREDKRENFPCKLCGITVRDEEYLELHMNLHEGKTELECRFCSKKYTRKVNVIRHMHKHWDKKKFQCEKCGLRFSETTLLYNHRLQHEAEEQPLICVVCKQSFKTKRTYNRHIWTHREDRPRFSCEYCSKTFVEKYTLKAHLRMHQTHNGEKGRSTLKKSTTTQGSNQEYVTAQTSVHKCIICDCSFPSKDSYNQHMELEHDVILKLKS